jgi:hypothetical protein
MIITVIGSGTIKIDGGGDGADIRTGIDGIGDKKAEHSGIEDLSRIMMKENSGQAPAGNQSNFCTNKLHDSHQRESNDCRPKRRESEAPAVEYVPIPEGSSSEAPVMRPGPSNLKNRLTGLVSCLISTRVPRIASACEMVGALAFSPR